MGLYLRPFAAAVSAAPTLTLVVVASQRAWCPLSTAYAVLVGPAGTLTPVDADSPWQSESARGVSFKHYADFALAGRYVGRLHRHDVAGAATSALTFVVRVRQRCCINEPCSGFQATACFLYCVLLDIAGHTRVAPDHSAPAQSQLRRALQYLLARFSQPLLFRCASDETGTSASSLHYVPCTHTGMVCIATVSLRVLSRGGFATGFFPSWLGFRCRFSRINGSTVGITGTSRCPASWVRRGFEKK